MKSLDPNDLRCCFCDKAIGKTDLVAVVETPDKRPAVTHLNHPGVRSNLITHPCQITTGALLLDVARSFLEGCSSDAAFTAMAERHAKLSLKQQTRLMEMNEAAKDEDPTR